MVFVLTAGRSYDTLLVVTNNSWGGGLGVEVCDLVEDWRTGGVLRYKKRLEWTRTRTAMQSVINL